ncbi:hypothetical protein GCM10008959_32630 [Deinococcus seoulensis]|uniref:Uncharacterized protein n=1 Tax=Deinococcus seoulensis TaxID=1837379 RepID=A0ABQ2RZ11_9DEIO|nr:hypothetical protein GCM10008959_32630 [Deinococcus seoulensis]
MNGRLLVLTGGTRYGVGMMELSSQAREVWHALECAGCRLEVERHLHPRWDAVVFVATIYRNGVPLISGSGASERQACLAALIEAVQVMPVPDAGTLLPGRPVQVAQYASTVA